VNDITQVAHARRLATALAAKCRFDETQTGKIAIIVAEAATNLIKHAGGGEVVLRGYVHASSRQLEILAVDQGPGMPDPERCLRDGFSTAGSPGTGLGAIRRLSGAFDLFSAPGVGSGLLSRNWSGAEEPLRPRSWQAGAVSVPKRGEAVCGDAWALERAADDLVLLVADGLGHGPVAATAAAEAVRVFRANVPSELTTIMQRIHDALRSTRGAAVAIAKIVATTRELQFVGVGNISATIAAGGQSRSLISHNGTAGVEARKIQEFTYPLPAGAVVVVHSDGLATHWQLPSGLGGRDPSLVAGVLYHRHQRGRDDATLVVLSESSAEPS
jgi:anti-sigma regulatory factor (Ser/Thr protein kinase)